MHDQLTHNWPQLGNRDIEEALTARILEKVD